MTPTRLKCDKNLKKKLSKVRCQLATVSTKLLLTRARWFRSDLFPI